MAGYYRVRGVPSEGYDNLARLNTLNIPALLAGGVGATGASPTTPNEAEANIMRRIAAELGASPEAMAGLPAGRAEILAERYREAEPGLPLSILQGLASIVTGGMVPSPVASTRRKRRDIIEELVAAEQRTAGKRKTEFEAVKEGTLPPPETAPQPYMGEGQYRAAQGQAAMMQALKLVMGGEGPPKTMEEAATRALGSTWQKIVAGQKLTKGEENGLNMWGQTKLSQNPELLLLREMGVIPFDLSKLGSMFAGGAPGKAGAASSVLSEIDARTQLEDKGITGKEADAWILRYKQAGKVK